MDRLQPVAHVRQRAVHDGRQRIGEIALFERCFRSTGWILSPPSATGRQNRSVPWDLTQRKPDPGKKADGSACG